MSTGNQVGAAAQGANASPSIEALLTQLGDKHRAVLTQAQVLGKAAGDWLASARVAPEQARPSAEFSARRGVFHSFPCAVIFHVEP